MSAAKVFIVTGASKGIGAAVVQYLLSHSHKVVLAARSQPLLEQTKKSHQGQVEFLAGDMTDPEIPQRLTDMAVKSFGRLDGMIISHGLLQNQSLAASTLDSIKHLYDVNVFSNLAMAKAGLRELKKTNGSIIWLSSGAATKTVQAWGGYGSSKAAVVSISAHLALEEPEITSIAVAPGRVNTDMQALLRDTGKNTMEKATYDTFVSAFNNGTLLKPEQPGNVIARLAIKPLKELSGKNVLWNAPELVNYQD